MEPLKIKSTEDTPKVLFDPLNDIFEISGRSLPEDVNQFYAPIKEWLSEYFQAPNPKTTFIFNLNYFNTASSKILVELFSYMSELSESGTDMEVKWYCSEDDEDIIDAGEEFAENVDFSFEIIVIPE